MNTRILGFIHTCFLLGTALTNTVNAAGIVVSGYDIGDAVLSGHGGGWAHSYTGTITPGAGFVHNTFPGTLATYGGVGSGTLTDGVIGSSLSTTQLFVAAPGATDGTPIDPSIFFTLPSAFTIDTIDIYGGDIPANGIPGAITEVTVGLLDTNFMLQTETFSTTPFGTVMSSLGVPVNDRIALAGSTLDGVGAFAVFLSDFVTPGTEGDWFSITEVEIFGEPAVVVPVPAAIWLFGSGLIGLIGISRSKEAV